MKPRPCFIILILTILTYAITEAGKKPKKARRALREDCRDYSGRSSEEILEEFDCYEEEEYEDWEIYYEISLMDPPAYNSINQPPPYSMSVPKDHIGTGMTNFE